MNSATKIESIESTGRQAVTRTQAARLLGVDREGRVHAQCVRGSPTPESADPGVGRRRRTRLVEDRLLGRRRRDRRRRGQARQPRQPRRHPRCRRLDGAGRAAPREPRATPPKVPGHRPQTEKHSREHTEASLEDAQTRTLPGSTQPENAAQNGTQQLPGSWGPQGTQSQAPF